jgi:hypothetical protein
VKHRNGTKFEFSNDVLVRANFTNITSGADLYDSFGRGDSNRPKTHSWGSYTSLERNFTGNFVGHPKPVTTTAIRNIAGFLPNIPELSDTAVLAVNSFVGYSDPNLTIDGFSTIADEAYNVTVDFVRAAKAANRTKLVLDVQGNSGGSLDVLFMLYLSLFPGETQFPRVFQARAHPQLAWIIKKQLEYPNPIWNQSGAVWPMLGTTKPDGTPWESFEEVYGPYKDASGRGEYTHPVVLNHTLIMASYIALNREVPPWKEGPFKPEDNIIVTDGLCGSACGMLVSALTHVHGVRTVAFGGRPMKAPMQAIGQVKGGRIADFSPLAYLNITGVPEDIKFAAPPTDYNPPLRVNGVSDSSGAVAFNPENAVMPGDPLGSVPLQFRYEAANCRLFYTWDMARDITAVWKAAAGVAWEGAKCVPGSTTNADGTMGSVPEYSKKVEDQYGVGKGPGSLGKK